MIKDLGLKEPYRSMVQLQTSEIGDDLAWYLTHSEQVPSCVALGVELDAQGEIAAAGGFMVQALPPGDQLSIDRLVDHLHGFPPTTSLLRQGVEPTAILHKVLDGQSFSVLQRSELVFNCPCSRETIADVLAGLGAVELDAMIQEQGGGEVICDYCREVYRYNRTQLEELRG